VPPDVADLGWFGGPAVAASAATGATAEGLWLAAIVALGLLALVALVAVFAREQSPVGGLAAPRRVRSVVDRAARSELGEALPALLLVGLLALAIALWLWGPTS
jgi:hypothetical protein